MGNNYDVRMKWWKELCNRYGEEKVLASLEKVKGYTKEVFELYLGLNDKKYSDVEEIAKLFNKSDAYIYNRILSVKRLIIKDLQNMSVEKKNKLEMLYDEYGKEIVDENILKLNPDEIELLEIFYGLNNRKKLTLTQLSEKFEVPRYTINNKINYSIFPKLINLITEKNNPKIKIVKSRIELLISTYGEEAVTSSLSVLDASGKIVLEHFYGLNGKKKLTIKEMSEFYGKNEFTIRDILYRKAPDIMVSYLEQPEKFRRKKNRLERLYDRYGKDKVDEAIKNFDSTSQEIIKRFFGVEGYFKKTAEEISKELNIAKSIVITVISGFDDKVINVIEKNVTLKKTVINNLYKLYGKDKVDEAINYIFSEEEKIILESFYGLNGNIAKNKKEIEKILNLKPGSLDFYRIHRLTIRLERYFNGYIQNSKSINLEYLYMKYGYSRVEDAISILDESDRIFFQEYYGLNQQRLSLEELMNKYNLKETSVRDKIGSRIIPKIICYIEGTSLEYRKNNRLNRIMILYGKDKVLEKIKCLSKQEQVILELIYGINGNIPHQYKEVSQILNKPYKDLKNKVDMIEYKLNKLLNPKYNRWNMLIDTYGETLVTNALNSLQDNKQKLIKSYFGIENNRALSDEKLAKFLKVEPEKVKEIVEKIIQEIIDNIVETKSTVGKDKLFSIRQKAFFDAIEYNNEQELQEALLTLSEEEQKLISLYYGISKEEVLELDELANEFDCNAKDILDAINNINERINKYIKSKKIKV